MKVKDKIIVVTGGGSGIGRELVLNLLGKGAKVATADINETSLLETVKLAGDNSRNLSTHILNITEKEAVDKFPGQVIEKHGQIDGIINNAGIIQPFVRLSDLDFNTIEKIINVNFWGTIYMVKAFLPYLQKRPEAHIVNVSSMGGFLPVPGQSIYGAAKAAVKLFTESLYAELKYTDIKVTVVFPGGTDTNINSNSGVYISEELQAKKAKFNLLLPAQAADQIIRGMEKDKYRVLVGNDSKMMDRLYRLAPRFATNLITKKMNMLLT